MNLVQVDNSWFNLSWFHLKSNFTTNSVVLKPFFTSNSFNNSILFIIPDWYNQSFILKETELGGNTKVVVLLF